MLRKQVFCGKEVTLQDVLQNKERRAARQNEALSDGAACLISFSLNIPGPVKQFPLAEKAFAEGEVALLDSFGENLIRLSVSDGVTGPEALYVCRLEPLAAKETAVRIEDGHPLGRLFDMDILAPGDVHLSRTELSLPARKCLLCDNAARVCGRSRAHSVEEMQDKIAALLEAYFTPKKAQSAANTVQEAMLFEVVLTPKPGLVDLADSGAHRDMDAFTFVSSAVALRDAFYEMYRLGRENAFSPLPGLFTLLRRCGKDAEENMLRATGGVNTHKGLLFSAGLLCGALGVLQAGTDRPVSAEELKRTAAALGQCSLADFKKDDPSLVPFRKYGVRGAREEAAFGFPSVFKIGLPVLEQTLDASGSFRFAAARTLIALIASVTDSNVLRRGGTDEAAWRKKQAQTCYEVMTVNNYEDILARLNEEYIRANISPGGSADLLALSILVHLWKKSGDVLPA